MVDTPSPERRQAGWWPFAPLLIVVASLLLGASYSLWQLSRANQWVRHTDEVRLALATFLSTTVDAETGTRGYIITKERDFLAPAERARARWRAELAEVRALSADNPLQQRRLARVSELAEARFADFDRLQAAADAGRSRDELTLIMRPSKQMMDQLRALLGDLQSEEQRLDRLRRQVAQRRWRLTLGLFTVGALACMMVIWLAWRQRASAEKRQRAFEQRFRYMVESVKDYAIITLDRDARVTTWNRGAQEIKGWRADEIIGQPVSRFYCDEDVRSGKCERDLETVTSAGRLEEEGWRARKDGSRFWANVVVAAIKDERGQLVGYTVVTRDLSERKQAAEALADEYQRRTDAERASRFAQTFIAILGHDLRNPLNAIVMGARLLQKKVGRADPKVIERIAASAGRMANMVDQLLDLTRSRLAGGITVDKQPASLSDIVGNVVEELRLAHPDREIRFQPLAREPLCYSDAVRMAQVVSNLVGNAIEHSPPATPVTVRLESSEHEMALSVHNVGAPIPPAMLGEIFEPYRRNAARSEHSKGLGLGLFITQQVVNAHGGRVEVRSSADEGTTFTAHIPCAGDQAAVRGEA